MTRLPLIGFYCAHALSTAGTKMTLVALPLLVYATTGSPTQTGAVAFAEMGMYVTAKALGAPLVDRLGRRRVGVIGDLLAAGTLACVPLLYGAQALPFAALLAILGISGAVQGLGAGAKRVLLPDVAEACGVNLDRALTIFDGVDRLGMLLGAPFGGVLVVWIGAANVLWFDAASFAISALLLSLTVPALATGVAASREPYFAALRAGWRFLTGNRLLLAMSVMVALTNTLDQAKTSVMMPVWVTDVAGDPAASGLIFGSGGLGAVAGNLLFIWLAPRLPKRLTYGICYLLAGGTQFFALAWLHDVSAVVVIHFGVGFLGAAINPILSAVSFSQVPQDMRARVFGMTGAMAFVGIPFGGLLGGLAVSGLGLIGSLWLAGGLMLVITLAPFVFRIWRRMDLPTAELKPVAEPVAA